MHAERAPLEPFLCFGFAFTILGMKPGDGWMGGWLDGWMVGLMGGWLDELWLGFLDDVR